MKRMLKRMKERFAKEKPNPEQPQQPEEKKEASEAHQRQVSDCSSSLSFSDSRESPKGPPAVSPIIESEEEKHDSIPRADLNQEIVVDDLLEDLPAIKDILVAQREDLCIYKLRLCCFLLEFDDPSNERHINKKSKILLEAIDQVITNKMWYNPVVMREIIIMVRVNLFRPLPRDNRHIWLWYEPEEDPDNLSGKFVDPHRRLVLEFLMRFVSNNSPFADSKRLRSVINRGFVLNIMLLMDSPDARDRDYLKCILHRLYAKIMTYRSFIRRETSNIFRTVIYQTGYFHGMPELLEILGSIINGFAVPVKEQHKQYLRDVMVPLHKTDIQCFVKFQPQYVYCLCEYVKKDQLLIRPIVLGMLQYWPLLRPRKEVLFLDELDDLLEHITPAQFEYLMVPIMERLAKCIDHAHFQVAERALLFWKDKTFRALIEPHEREVFVIVYPALNRSRNHWNNIVCEAVRRSLKTFERLNSPFFMENAKRVQHEETEKAERRRVRDLIWAQLELDVEEKCCGGADNSS